uniref:Quinolinate synthase A n=2 Tax=Thermotoga maritima (strain ATCC 43589 / DSM 3109 / JCM 10099 / NBRC 100826 / MSB8) TaxID=243274 RepID=UPI00084A2F0C|nr:Chain A, Quinolinate synthase A [Thermotoga maritima MSB8]5LQS_A Chain A, Quinolinate synthase A [Thermotoga maritima MSB8]6F48_A Chain A, Quinolinate synthase A [Thermotoga maritima]6F4D_A Chain A, Quinolinate synthase A [Thermotoga maritima]6I0K_A Chain A, Quinolinate synthase A [Thermotoga maritima MSB8]6I0P_A Chain A, Quinolinate synthase A [Thermotoga maritima MSB8]6I0R_A Chain A, Quinolinate synthase A [Thermotoga maritima MSB8]
MHHHHHHMVDEILKLKKEKGYIILAHNFQIPELQDIADFVGDSLQLARKAMELSEKKILFLGVDFMAELVKILNPDKKVIVPDRSATCPMANRLTPEIIREYREKFPDAPVVLYVNSTSECKTLADVICTSANAVEVVKKLDSSVVIFGPDRNLGEYVAEKTGKKVITIPENGHCPVHQFNAESIDAVRKKYPDAKVIVHPECPKPVRDKADYVGSTGQMEKIPERDPSRIFVIGTEIGMIHKLKKKFPDREFVPLEMAVCVNMKKNTLENTLHALQTESFEVILPKEVIEKAKKPILRMFELMG